MAAYAVSTTASDNGAWSFTGPELGFSSLSDFPEDGDYLYYVTSSDAAGNTSSKASRIITVDLITDTTPPPAPTVNAVMGDNIVTLDEVNDILLTGSAEANSTVKVWLQGDENTL